METIFGISHDPVAMKVPYDGMATSGQQVCSMTNAVAPQNSHEQSYYVLIALPRTLRFRRHLLLRRLPRLHYDIVRLRPLPICLAAFHL